MCYSGRCIWEDFMGDCRFPMYIKEVREKYKYPNCGMNVQCEEEQVLIDNINKDIKNIINKSNNSK